MRELKIRGRSGFTLVEMMITVVIISIITAFAYPAYTKNMQRGKRADVRTVLMEDAQFMERFFTENSSYLLSTAGVAPVLPQLVSPRSATGTGINYNITFTAQTATSYTLQATPVNSMASDDCKSLTLNNLGQKNVVGSPTNGWDVQSCWNK